MTRKSYIARIARTAKIGGRLERWTEDIEAGEHDSPESAKAFAEGEAWLLVANGRAHRATVVGVIEQS